MLAVDDVLAVLRDHVKDSATLNAVAKDLLAVEKEAKEARVADKTPKAKTRFVVLVRGDDVLRKLVEGGAWIVSVPDDESVTATYSGDSLLSRITKAAKTSNEAPKRRRGKGGGLIRSFAEAMRWLKPKTVGLSGSAFKIKTRESTEVVVVPSEDLVL